MIIHDLNYEQFKPQLLHPLIDGEKKARGLVPRNYSATPYGSMSHAPAFDLPLIPRSEWPERIADLEKSKGRVSDYRARGNNGKRIPPLDQNGKGYCWAHSTTQAVQLQRAINNLPYVGLSAYSVACIIKSYADEGGWCGESLAFLAKTGVASEAYWPQRSMERSNDNAKTRENMALHKVTEGFYDLSAALYDQHLSFEQEITCALLCIPQANDYDWWGHSVCIMDAVNGQSQFHMTRTESGKLMQLSDFDLAWGMNDPVVGGIGKRGLNSWGPSFGENEGEFILAGTKAISNSAVAIRVTGGSIS